MEWQRSATTIDRFFTTGAVCGSRGIALGQNNSKLLIPNNQESMMAPEFVGGEMR